MINKSNGLKLSYYVIIQIMIGGIILAFTIGCFNNSKLNLPNDEKGVIMETNKRDTAIFGLGCFWCGDAIFKELKGVDTVLSGYSGGVIKNPSYADICTGTTGHAEVIQLIYDPSVVSYKTLLEVFWQVHDPTTLNRQGNDIGSQYRSAIFYYSESQKVEAEFYKNQLNKENVFSKPIITEITQVSEFYKAENYHQDYYANNNEQSYCRYVVRPKLDKFKKAFQTKLK